MVYGFNSSNILYIPPSKRESSLKKEFFFKIFIIPRYIIPRSHSFVLSSFAMGSICIYCMSLPFSPTSNHRRIRNYMGGFQKQYLTTQPTTMAVTTNAPIVRRSANYPPSLWSYEYLQSLTNNYVVSCSLVCVCIYISYMQANHIHVPMIPLRMNCNSFCSYI